MKKPDIYKIKRMIYNGFILLLIIFFSEILFIYWLIKNW